MQDGFARRDLRSVPRTAVASGVWALHLKADRMYASRQEPFLVTETNASHILSPRSRPAYDGQWRQAAWALVSRGARMVEYWHWHTTHFGAESSWGGVLPHSGRPGRTYREIARLGAEFETAGDLVADLIPDAEIAMLFSLPSHWLMEEQPPLLDGQADAGSYAAFFEPFYRAAFDAGLPVRIVHPSQLQAAARPGVGVTSEDAVRRYPVLVASGLYVADDVTLDWLSTYAEAGGHLVIGPRTGYADEEARPRTAVQPARLADAAGAWYEEYSNLNEAVPVSSTAEGPAWEGPLGGSRWLEGLGADSADVLATYDHPHFGQWAAVTTRGVGQGRITCVGTVPDPGLGRALMTWLRPARDEPRWRDLPDPVTTSSATASDGRRLHFVSNWSFAPTEARLPFAVKDLLGSDQFAAGESLGLGPWDVRVLVQR
jgi:beta-galactosidase